MESVKKNRSPYTANAYSLIVLNVYTFCDLDTQRFVVECFVLIVFAMNVLHATRRIPDLFTFMVHSQLLGFSDALYSAFGVGRPSLSLSLSLSVCAMASGKADSAFGLATWHQWSSRSAMERVSDIDIQSLHSALSEVLISPQSSKAEEDICLSMTSKSASDMGIDN